MNALPKGFMTVLTLFGEGYPGSILAVLGRKEIVRGLHIACVV